MFNINFGDHGIRTADLLCWKRMLCQLSHNLDIILIQFIIYFHLSFPYLSFDIAKKFLMKPTPLLANIYQVQSLVKISLSIIIISSSWSFQEYLPFLMNNPQRSSFLCSVLDKKFTEKTVALSGIWTCIVGLYGEHTFAASNS